MSEPARPDGPNSAYRVGRAIQFLGFVGGSVALAMTMFVVANPERSTAPALFLALGSGAVFTVGWLVQRHWGRTPDDRS